MESRFDTLVSFFRLLTCLAVFDNVFIICSLLEGVRKHIRSSQIHEYLFGYFLYQFHNMVMCCSAYTTVVLALERYRAVWRPIEYHNNVNSLAHPWRRVLWIYVTPVVAFSILFNLPKFFEVKFQEHTHYEEVVDPETQTTHKVFCKYFIRRKIVLFVSNDVRHSWGLRRTMNSCYESNSVLHSAFVLGICALRNVLYT